MANLLNIWIVLIGLAASSCNSKGHWKHDHIDSGSAQFSSSRLSYVFPDPNHAIQLEVFQTQDSRKGYLYVKSHPISAYQNDPKKALVSIQLAEKHFSCIAIRHEGGHRLLLPEETVSSILEALSQNIEVWVELSGYKAKLSPEGFLTCYEKFQSPPKFSKLVQLPF